ncbi:hypothetical protein F5B17DRAFT_319111 [Nemania serpens]|nr:hypothetical protein F5B17DRAFT_319111 [Nemania serpens]
MSSYPQANGLPERSHRFNEDFPHSQPTASMQVNASNNSQTSRDAASSGLPVPSVYRMTFRHVNCRGPMRAADEPPSHDVCDLTVPTWPSSVPYDILNELESMPYDIHGWRFNPDANPYEMEVPSCRTCPFSIYYLLTLYAHRYYADNDTHHSRNKKGHGIRVAAARIVWADPHPVFLESYNDYCAAHSIAISKEHLALVQARGHIDHIHIEFETRRGLEFFEKHRMRSLRIKSWIARWVRQRKSDLKEGLIEIVASRVRRLYVES